MKKIVKQVGKNQKYEETDLKIWGNQPRKSGKHLTINIRKRIQSIRKSLSNSELLWDFLEFLKNGNSPKVILDLFPCWGVSISQFSIIVTWYILRHITMIMHYWLKFWSHDTDISIILSIIYLIKQDIRIFAYSRPNGWTDWADIFCGHSIFFSRATPGFSAYIY